MSGFAHVPARDRLGIGSTRQHWRVSLIACIKSCSKTASHATLAHKNSGKHKDLRVVGRAASGDVAGASLLGWGMRLLDTANAPAVTVRMWQANFALHTNCCDAAGGHRNRRASRGFFIRHFSVGEIDNGPTRPATFAEATARYQ